MDPVSFEGIARYRRESRSKLLKLVLGEVIENLKILKCCGEGEQACACESGSRGRSRKFRLIEGHESNCCRAQR